MAGKKTISADDMRLVLPIGAMTAIGAVAAFGGVMVNGSIMESRISFGQAKAMEAALQDALEHEADSMDASGPDYVLAAGRDGILTGAAKAGRRPLDAGQRALVYRTVAHQGAAPGVAPPPIVIRINGEPYVAASRPATAGEQKVLLKRLGPQFFSRFAKRYELADLTVEAKRQKPFMFRNQISLRPGDDSQGALHWNVRPRVRDNATGQVNFGLGMVLLIAGGGFYAYRRTRRLAQSLVASEAHAQHLALHDPMTGLANRALFASRLDLALEQRRRTGGLVGVFVIDLDRFKHVNDSLGHQAGDELIREAGRRLLGVCRATDTVARLGGDEFAIVASLPDMTSVLAMLDRTTSGLSGQIALPGGKAELKGSIGVTVIDDNQIDAPEAMRQADLAMYKAKEQGRGRHAMFQAEMDESLRLRRATESDLRQAMANGELKVHYQPQFMARSGKLESVEALVRWTHPERGDISPAYFIPIAEECGLIDELGEIVMRQACKDAGRWPHLKVAINVSPVQLRRAGFVKTCSAILRESGVEASRIELEITEGVLLENDEAIQRALLELRSLGFKLALDDFGTGYSSLSYLNVYPVDKIKIDRSFISQLGVQEDADKVVRAIVRLGKALGLQVTAEGVETEAQRSELISAGCNVLQGYLGGRPGEASTIDELIRAEKAARAAA